MKPSVVNCMITFLWSFSFTLAGLPFIYFNNWDQGVRCSFGYLLHDWIYLVSGICEYSCMAFSVFLYGLILKTARKVYAKSLKKASEGPDNERNRKIIKNIRSAKVMGYVTLALVLSWSPYKVYQIRYGLDMTTDFTFNMSGWLVFLGIFNSAVNPFIYAYQRRDFKKGCQKLFGCYRNEGQPGSKVEESSRY
ncbi:5-hydroxytryptamine receptor 1F-like [Ostrea edulis]|uniref:5-hydroxytryptamine receptor 1F-like n=1 Tax=Ostrea edulis TaxID=37623 RepID=UPI0024AEA2A0|nr:5-hydroxytryptamine receptor 1F-like [Ostrea edulis]